MARTQEQRKGETRRLLLDAAADLFARKGVHAVSVDAVADAAGRTSGSVYAHFGGKDGLLLALADERGDAAAVDVAAAIGRARSLDARLAASWRSYAAAAGDDGETWALLEHELWLEGARRSEVGERLASRFAGARRRIGRGMAALAHDDDPHVDLPISDERTGALVLGLLYGLEMQHRLDPAAVPDDLAVDGLRLLLGRPPKRRRGLRSRRGTVTPSTRTTATNEAARPSATKES